ncbi:MAG TPA: TetR/AcrR family transcriptional regulator [Candidatus Dormibacteraeota bacterium]|nr:TetR/AcrR family transcriptional regulator [Candidatus Dormibacteraeota bacterium]
MPKISTAVRSERRQQLIDAAWRCAGRRGYRDMTVDEVCAEAQVSKGAFYGYFTSKQDLLVALLEEDAAGLDAVLDDLGRRDVSNVARLRSFAREMCERGADPSGVQLRSDLWAAILTEPLIRDRVVAAVQRRRAVLRGWIEGAVATGELAPIPANAFASVLLALGDGLTLHSSLDPSGFRWTNITRVLAAVFGGLGPETS